MTKMEIYEFSYEKYGEHPVAIRCENGGLRLFDAVKIFSKNNGLAEYERVKEEAADFAKRFVAQFNSVSALESKLAAVKHLLNHIHREVASLEDFDAESLMQEIEATISGERIFDDNKYLHEQLAAAKESNEALMRERESIIATKREQTERLEKQLAAAQKRIKELESVLLKELTDEAQRLGLYETDKNNG